MGKCQQCIIRNLNSLKALKNEELIRLSDTKTEVNFKKGDVLFTEGTTLNGVFCVSSGACKLSKLNSNGKEQIVRFGTKGDLLGYRSVVAEESVSLTVTALDDMQVCFIPKEEMSHCLKTNPDFTLDMMKTACADLKEANTSISKMAQKKIRQRLADTLLFLSETFETNNDGFINIVLSREEISSVVGTATESTIRLLSELKKEGTIDLKGKQIKILDSNRLKQISEDM